MPVVEPISVVSTARGRSRSSSRASNRRRASARRGAEVRLLYVIDSLAPFGAEQSLTALAPRYRARGIGLDVAYLKEGPGLLEELQVGGARCFRVDGGKGRVARIRSLRSLIEYRRPDLIHTTLFEADIAGRIAGAAERVPVVSSLVSEPYGREHAEDPRIAPWRLRGAQLVDGATARLVRRFHALTSHGADVMGRRLRIARSRIDVIPRGRDLVALGTRNPERRQRIRRSLGIGDDERLVLAVARQEHQKGLDVLLRAMPAVRAQLPARLIVAGREGGQSPLLRRLIRDLRLDGAVSFLGVRRDVPDLLASADAFAFPSRFEGFGCALLEAMALEAPVVASDLGPIREVVGPDMPALLVPTDDPCALGRAVVSTLMDGPGAASRVEVARTRFLQQFTIERVADDMVRFYERALAEGEVDT